MAENRVEPITAQVVAADLRKTVEDSKAFAREALHEGKRTVSQYTEAAKQKATEVKTVSEDYIKENPWKSVLGALGIGVAIGLLIGARRR